MGDVLVALLVATIVNLFILLAFRKRYDDELFRFVALIYACTLTLRYVLAFYLWLHHTEPGFSLSFWGDSQTYDGFGAVLADGWSNGGAAESWKATIEGRVNRGFIYFVAVVYYFFGRNVLLVQFLNGIIGALTPVVILEIGLLLYDRSVARIAMLLTSFFPQMIFWSSALYKDPAVMLAIALSILAVYRLRERFSLTWVVIYLGAAAALVWLRFYIFYAVAVATAVGIFVQHRRGVLVGVASQFVLVTAVILLLLYTPVGREILLQSRFLDVQVLEYSRLDLSRAGSGFGADADVSSFGGILSFLPVGIAYLLFAPFPWSVSGLRQALALPDVLLWYALVPALIRGIGNGFRRLRQTMPIFVFTTALTVAYGAFLGNVGTAYRQRTQIMMFYFLFVADGLKRRTGTESEAPEEGEPGRDLVPTARQ
jgi:hypothetical protein